MKGFTHEKQVVQIGELLSRWVLWPHSRCVNLQTDGVFRPAWGTAWAVGWWLLPSLWLWLGGELAREVTCVQAGPSATVTHLGPGSRGHRRSVCSLRAVEVPWPVSAGGCSGCVCLDLRKWISASFGKMFGDFPHTPWPAGRCLHCAIPLCM